MPTTSASTRTANPPAPTPVLAPVPSSPLAERILAVVRTRHYTSINGIVKALAASGERTRRQDVYAEVGSMLVDGRLVKINDVFQPGGRAPAM